MDAQDRRYLDLKFQTIEDKIEDKIGAMSTGCQDHEERIRDLENIRPWQWIAQAIVALGAAAGIKTGFGD